MRRSLKLGKIQSIVILILIFMISNSIQTKPDYPKSRILTQTKENREQKLHLQRLAEKLEFEKK